MKNGEKMKVYAVGGYDLVGKNMTVIDFGSKAVVFDVGLNMEEYSKLSQERERFSEKDLISYRTIPDISDIKHILKKVVAVAITHAHLDHLGAFPYLAKYFKHTTVIGTPFTIEILNQLLKEHNVKKNFKIKKVMPNSIAMIEGIQFDFINITHSTPQTVVIRAKYKDEEVAYANDFKLDPNPVLGKKPNYDFLTGLEPDLLILDSTRVETLGKTPSESMVRGMIEDIISLPNLQTKGIIATTFSSHIARLMTIKKIGQKHNRKVYFMGRSMAKYIQAAENAQIASFSDSEVIQFKRKARQALKEIAKDPEHSLVVMTGHQGEPRAMLTELATENIKFDFSNFFVIFSCSTIPTPTNIANREFLENKLMEKNVPFFKDVHVSGHASREDLRTFIEMIHPKSILPAHGDITKRTKLAKLSKDIGIEHILLMDEGDVVEL